MGGRRLVLPSWRREGGTSAALSLFCFGDSVQSVCDLGDIFFSQVSDQGVYLVGVCSFERCEGLVECALHRCFCNVYLQWHVSALS